MGVVPDKRRDRSSIFFFFWRTLRLSYLINDFARYLYILASNLLMYLPLTKTNESTICINQRNPSKSGKQYGFLERVKMEICTC